MGHVLLTMGAIPQLGAAGQVIDYLGLLVIALGTGGIKPCVSAFAADQFPVSMARQRAQFFSFFYFAINAGALISKFITPVLRGGYACLGQTTCFPLAFGVPGVLMFIATLIFVAGWRHYTIYERSGDNVICQVCGVIYHAMINRFTGKPRENCHLLDYADDKYSPTLISDTKNLVRVVIPFLPVVVFWALFDQQGSTWLLQATRVNGRVGHLTILPDQVSLLNPLIIIIMVPIFEAVIYPVLWRFHLLRTSLQRMAVGGILAALSFVIAGFLQLEINKTMVAVPLDGYHRFGVQNMLDCEIKLQPSGIGVPSKLSEMVDLNNLTHIDVSQDCGFNRPTLYPVNHLIDMQSEAYLVTIMPDKTKERADIVAKKFKLQKVRGQTHVIITPSKGLLAINASVLAILKGTSGEGAKRIRLAGNGTVIPLITPLISEYNEFDLHLNTCDFEGACEQTLILGGFEAKMGAIFSISLSNASSWSEPLELIRPNTVNILLMIPQYFIMTIGEILFSITGLEFSYSQAAPSLKSVVQAMWLLTVAFGNVIDMIVSGSNMIPQPHVEFFVYAALMGVVMVIFIIIAYRYKYVNYEQLNAKARVKDADSNTKDYTLSS